MRKVLLVLIGILIVFLGGILYLNLIKEDTKEVVKSEEEVVLTSFDFFNASCVVEEGYFCVKTISDVSISGIKKDLVLKVAKSDSYLLGTSNLTDLTATLYWGGGLVYTFKTDIVLADSLASYNKNIKIDILDNRYLVINYLISNQSLTNEKVLDIVDITDKQVELSLGLGSLTINTLNGTEFDGNYYKIVDGSLFYYTYECDQVITTNYSLKEMSLISTNGVLSAPEVVNEYNNTNSTIITTIC